MAKIGTRIKRKIGRTGARKRISFTNIMSIIFLIAGVFLLIVSIIFASSIVAFLSLGLLLWGAILLYARAQEYTPKFLLRSSLFPSLEIMNHLLEEVGFEGGAIYLPPTHFDNSKSIKIHMLKKEEHNSSKSTFPRNMDNTPSISASNSILLTPLGIELMKLFESKLNKNLTQVHLDFLYQALPKTIVQDLELADEVIIDTKDNQIKVRITRSVFKNLHNPDFSHSPFISLIGCPLCSAIACAITKTAQKPLFIKKIQQSKDGKMINVTYEILDKTRTEVVFGEGMNKNLNLEPATVMPRGRQSLMPFLTVAFLMSFGSILLIPVAWTMYLDMTIWNKSLLQTLLESRTGQSLSLGIGMTLIHYLLISFSFLFTGLLIYLRRKEII